MKRQFKRAASVLLALTIALSAMLGTVVTAGAATDEISINATEVTIYAIDEWAEEYISIPSEYPTSFQLSVSGAEEVEYYSYQDKYEGINVSDSGLITPYIRTLYWYLTDDSFYGVTEPEPDKTPLMIDKDVFFGEYTVEVYADDETFEVNVNVVDYAEIYAEKVMDDYLAENITDDMTTYEKLDAIAKFVADRNYDNDIYRYTDMIVSGGGNDSASTETVIYMAQKVGLRAWEKTGYKEFHTSFGDVTMVYDGETYYEVDAGYNEEAPRYYRVELRNSLFRYYNVGTDETTVYQYDEENVPENFVIPAKIDGKTVVAIDEEFSVYLMTRGRNSIKNVVLPNTLKEIGEYAFDRCNNLKSITIPQSVETIGENAFGYTIDWNVYERKKIDGFTIYGYKASAAEEYANENGFSFVALDDELLIGDVNGDGVVNVSDATALQKHLANGKIFDEALLKIADTNGDGEVTVADATLIQKYLANSVSSLG